MVSKCFMLNIMFYVIVSFGCKVIHNIRNTQKKREKIMSENVSKNLPSKFGEARVTNS